MSAGSERDDAALVAKIVARVRDRGPMPFAEFMDAALYDPDHGYYTTGARRLGPGGDFFTASDAGTAFGTCIARQLAEFDDVLGRPDPFRVVEFGAGRGWLARDVLAGLARDHDDLSRRADYVALDRSPDMRRAIAENAPDRVAVGDPAAAGTDLGPPRAGCVLAVELFDALPVHRIRRRGTRLVEVRVGVVDEGGHPRLIEVETDPSPEVASEASRWNAAPADGSEAEVCLGVGPQLRRMAEALGRGFLLVVDYGHEADELAGPAHARGTLLAYRRHRVSEDVLADVGRQDLTAHVNWTAFDGHARDAGLVPLGRVTQDRFLIANGILGLFEQADDAASRDPDRIRARMRAMPLIHPHGMGRAFQVAVLAKGVDPAPALRGLVDPFAR